MKLHGCGDCAYYEPRADKTGECHRYPPMSDCHWPRVFEDHWCGELKMSAKGAVVPVDLPDDLKVLLDRQTVVKKGTEVWGPGGDQWRPVRVPLLNCRECDGTGYSVTDTELHCPACHGLGLARRGDGE